MSAILGLFNFDQAAARVLFGTYATLLHRAHYSGGIASSDGTRLYTGNGRGYVFEIFTDSQIKAFNGDHAVCVSGAELEEVDFQPVSANTKWGPIALAYDGGTPDLEVIRETLEKSGTIFRAINFGEVVIQLLAGSRASRLEEAVYEVLSQIRGGWAMVLMTPEVTFVARDPWGIRPLFLGEVEPSHALVASSETAAFTSVQARCVREVKPGEIIKVSRQTTGSVFLPEKSCLAHCLFELVYISRPESQFEGVSIGGYRYLVGRRLAALEPAENADLVVPVLDSGADVAEGFAFESRLRLIRALPRNHYVTRTVVSPQRSLQILAKFNPHPELLRGQSVVLVDDSIQTGDTITKLVAMVRGAGAKAVHVRIGSAPLTGPCHYGFRTPDESLLVTARVSSVPQIRQEVNADSLAFFPLEEMVKIVGIKSTTGFCTACFNRLSPFAV